MSDAGPDSEAFVGSPTHFELIAFGEDEVPDFHQDLPVRVTLDGALLYETTLTSGHDYDGVHGFDVTFPHAGAWRVELLGQESVRATLTGTAIEAPLPNADISVNILQSAPPTVAVHTVSDGQPATHTDHLIEYLAGDRTILRTKVHAHADVAQWTEGHVPGADRLRVTAYTAAPEQGDPIAPTVWQATWTTIRSGIPALQVPPQQSMNDVTVARGERTLVGTYDPYTIVAPDTLQHLQTMVVGDERSPVRHMSFEVQFRGPDGLIFQSERGAGGIHEHDGIYELAARMGTPGQYVADITAYQGDWSEHIQMVYTVAPPVMPTILGPQIVSQQGDTATGAPLTTAFAIEGLDGRPFAHGELEWQVRNPAGQVLLRDKLHTHADGIFPATLGLQPGTYQLAVDPFPLDLQPTVGYYKDSFESAMEFAIHINGEAPASAAEPAPAPAETTPVPVWLLFIGLVAATLTRKR